MSQGRIVEQGTHKELLEKRSIYYDLIEKQRIQAEKQNEITTGEDSAEESVSTDLEKHAIFINEGEESPDCASTTQNEKQSDESSNPEKATEVKHSTWTLIRFVAGLNKGETAPMLGGLLFSIIAGAGNPT